MNTSNCGNELYVRITSYNVCYTKLLRMEIRKLNTLRGIAALIVLISHYSNATNLFHGVLGTGGGQFGSYNFV